MEERFDFMMNGVEKPNLTMSEAISIARNKAIGGRSVELSVWNGKYYTKLATYEPDSRSPLCYTNTRTSEKQLIPCCSVDIVPLAYEHF